MHSAPMILSEAVYLFGSALIVALVLRMARVPSIIGFLLAGMVIGPAGWALISPEGVAEFAEIGVVLLLFTVGLELSPRQLLSTGPRLLLIVALEFLLVVGLTVAVLSVFGYATIGARVLVGIAVTLSSTAIVLKLLSDRGETDSSAGLIITGVLLLQDVAVILIMLALPILADAGESESLLHVFAAELLAVGGLAAIVIAARYLLPHILDVIVRHGGRELSALFAVLMACGGAWLAGLAEWSIGLGACIAGLLLADADHRHQLVAEITPFRDVFNAVFFIALGMQVNLDLVFANWATLLVAVLTTIVLKMVINAAALLASGWPLRLGIHVGIGLCTVSEFAYILAVLATELGLLSADILAQLVAYTVGTMLVGTILFPFAGKVAQRSVALVSKGAAEAEDPLVGSGEGHNLDKHVIIVGYGLTGRNVAQMLKATHIPFCVIEMNPRLIQQARTDDAAVIVGDATRSLILEHAGAQRARVLLVAINDSQSSDQIVGQASAAFEHLFILVRVRYATRLDALYSKGASLVIPEDFETSIEIAAHVLKEFRIPGNIINAQLANIRAGNYGLLRGKPADRAMHRDLLRILELTATDVFYLSEGSPACGATLKELDLRANTGANIIAVVRDSTPTTNLTADFELRAGDVLVMVGAHKQLQAAQELLEGDNKPRLSPPEEI